ncbi:amidase family protein [Oenococcus oeni]|uniref:amidase family protein n=1 Tax=Oenococcus oeni TaxID=1247 RepID=UPI0008F87140|nr:amidase family protein [Oenococcus oeni]OIK71346.1 glutamyl-tRNA amidotransferase [Oenococcus oeni]OIK97535.1 glutamyl-tRNA amidotransferase [Oenococcus oeni]OIL55190.1 glutamyl-tRNA amidotransferase [Oenococcus oeni]OIL56563.1 glutamyl-tRNA amidotransferase [Oenococcus oeni]
MAREILNKKEFYQLVNDFDLTEKEKTVYWKELSNGFFSSFEELSKHYQSPVKKPVYRRTFQSRPYADDRYNAWYVKTKIEHAESGSLLGKKIAVKDNISIAGVPMSMGTKLLESYKPKEDATVISRLLDHGADILGKSVSENLFCSGSSFTADSGPVENPKVPGYSAGGSSSGSGALVASQQVDMALGCDQTGSIRIPSAWCGIYGLKPTRGLVPYTGIGSVDQLLDTVGPMANKVSDLALLLDAIAGKDGLDGRQAWLSMGQSFSFAEQLSSEISGKKVGLLQQGFRIEGVSDPEVDQTVQKNVGYFKELGVSVQDISVPEFDLARNIADVINTLGTSRQQLRYGGSSFGTDTYYPIDLSETFKSRINSKTVTSLAPLVQLMLYGGEMADGQIEDYYGRAQNMIPLVKKAFEAAFKEVDILALPTVPFTARKLPPLKADIKEQIDSGVGAGHNDDPFNIIGCPAISIPCKLDEGQKPIGMMLVTPFGQDQQLLDFAYAYERMIA